MATIYGTLAEADEYLADRADCEHWLQLSIDEKTRRLRTATLDIEMEQYAGTKYDDDQELKFPRDDSEDGEVPDDIEHACYEQAAYVGTARWKIRQQRIEAAEQGITSVNAGGVAETYTGRRISHLCARAAMLVRPYLLRIGKIV